MNEQETLRAIHEIRNKTEYGEVETNLLYEYLLSSPSRAVQAAAIQALRFQQDECPGFAILVGGRFAREHPSGDADAAFRMYVLDVFGIKDKGAIVVGYVSSGTVRQGQALVLAKADGRDVPTRCVELHPQQAGPIRPGALANILLEGLTMGEIGQGDAVVGTGRASSKTPGSGIFSLKSLARKFRS